MGEKKADPKVVRFKFVRRVWRNKMDVVAFGKGIGKVLKVDVRRRHFLMAVTLEKDVPKLPAGVKIVEPGTPEHPPTMGFAPRSHQQRTAGLKAARVKPGSSKPAPKKENAKAADKK